MKYRTLTDEFLAVENRGKFETFQLLCSCLLAELLASNGVVHKNAEGKISDENGTENNVTKVKSPTGSAFE